MMLVCICVCVSHVCVKHNANSSKLSLKPKTVQLLTLDLRPRSQATDMYVLGDQRYTTRKTPVQAASLQAHRVVNDPRGTWMYQQPQVAQNVVQRCQVCWLACVDCGVCVGFKCHIIVMTEASVSSSRSHAQGVFHFFHKGLLVFREPLLFVLARCERHAFFCFAGFQVCGFGVLI
jgi:hypothetical protein